jgi:hypothetical protein
VRLKNSDLKNEKYENLLLSEVALAKDWDKPEEDEAWKHLQRVSD